MTKEVQTETYDPRADDVGQARGHVDVFSNDEICAVNDDLILLALSFPPSLLVDHPHACACPRARLGRLLRDDELESGHGLEAAFERFSRCEILRHVWVVQALLEDNLIVGCLVVEGRLGEVVQHTVTVNALLELGRCAPLNLV